MGNPIYNDFQFCHGVRLVISIAIANLLSILDYQDDNTIVAMVENLIDLFDGTKIFKSELVHHKWTVDNFSSINIIKHPTLSHIHI